MSIVSNIKVLCVLFLILIIPGCATLDKKECKTADWKAIGFEDGARGYGLANRFGQHRKACAEYGIKAKFEIYRLGHNQGIRQYCTPEQGYRLGRMNKRFPAHCPADLVSSTRRGFNVGHQIYLEKSELQEQISELEEDMEILDSEILELGNERKEHLKYLAIAEKGLTNPAATKLEKVVFYTQRNTMKSLIREKDDEIDHAEAEKERYQYSITKIQREIKSLDNQAMPNLSP